MKKCYGIDWLRVVACIGIIVMHVCTNNTYEIDGFIYNTLIPAFTDFVCLFMAVSAFGMCSGYFNKVMSSQINWIVFYQKRYAKILPFFMLLIIIDLILNFSIPSLCEGFTEITLLHGFIPNSLSVIGVGWFLGTVFIFYLIFPFYCVLIKNKACAWCSFAVSVILNFICSSYFGLDRKNFLYSLCYFIAGGLVYLYKDKLEKVKWYFYLPVIILSLFLYFLIGGNTLTRLLVTVALLMFAASINCGEIKIISFMSNISMEMYLSHMFVFRAIEKLRLNALFGNGLVQCLVSVALVLIGTIVFSFCSQQIINKSQTFLKTKRESRF